MTFMTLDNPIIPISAEPTDSDASCLKNALTHFDNDISFECNVDYISPELICASRPELFTLVFDMPIMIQARWHKKVRIRKKWLKRYGMKEDIVKTIAKNVRINETDRDAMATDFSFVADNIKYAFRNDQLRRGIKIEGANNVFM